VHWYKGENSPLAKRLKMVALNAIMRTVMHNDTAPEVKLAMQTALLTFNEWLDDEADDNDYEVLNTYFSTYWKTGEWLGHFEVKPLPPGSPI